MPRSWGTVNSKASTKPVPVSLVKNIAIISRVKPNSFELYRELAISTQSIQRLLRPARCIKSLNEESQLIGWLSLFFTIDFTTSIFDVGLPKRFSLPHSSDSDTWVMRISPWQQPLSLAMILLAIPNTDNPPSYESAMDN